MIQLSKLHRFGLSSLSGLLLGISFPYTGSLFFLSFVALVPLLVLEDYIQKKNYRSGKVFSHAYVAFFFYNLITTWWIYFASTGGAAMAVLANSLLMATVFWLFHLVKKHIGSKEGYLGLIILWVAFEYLHFYWELSWPWLNFGNMFSRVPWLVQWYQYTGILGGTIWILILNILFFKWLQPSVLYKKRRNLTLPLVYLISGFLLIPACVSWFQYVNYSEKIAPEKVVILQPNIDPYLVKFSTPIEGQIQKTVQLARGKVSNQTDLVLAPETALSYEFYEDQLKTYTFYPILDSAIATWKCPLLIGASTVKSFETKNSSASRPYTGGPGFWESYNTSLLMYPNGETEFVHKSKLVLGVEKVPFIHYLPFLEEWSINQGGASGTLGIAKSPSILRGKNGWFAPVVCYESIYGEFVAEQIRKGGEYIAIITNDGWWENTPGYKQHLSFARLRAVENRRSVARSANTGCSAIINQRGDVIQASAWWEAKAIVGELNRNKTMTIYTTHGEYLGRSSTFVAALLLLFTWVRRFKKKYGISEKVIGRNENTI